MPSVIPIPGRQAGTTIAATPSPGAGASPGTDGDWRGPPALAHPGRRRAGPADGRARRHDREHRAAISAARTALLRHPAAVGGHRVLPRLRQPAAAGRQAHRPDRPESDLHRGPHRLRGGIRARRGRRELRHAHRGARLPGRLRRAAGTGRAVAADRHVPRLQRPGQGVRRVRRHRRRRRCGRPAARRPADPVPGPGAGACTSTSSSPPPHVPARSCCCAGSQPGRGHGWTCPASPPRSPACSASSTASPTPPAMAGTPRPPGVS